MKKMHLKKKKKKKKKKQHHLHEYLQIYFLKVKLKEMK